MSPIKSYKKVRVSGSRFFFFSKFGFRFGGVWSFGFRTGA